ELAGLEVEPAGAATRALAGVAAVFARRIDMRGKHRVERVEHLGDLEVFGVIDRADEVAPKFLEHLPPVDLVVGNAVELVLQRSGEIVLDITPEKTLKERDDDASLVLGVHAA